MGKAVKVSEKSGSLEIILRTTAFVKPFFGLLLFTLLLNSIFAMLSAVSLTTIKPLFQMIFDTGSPAGSGTIDSKLLNDFYNFMEKLVTNPADKLATLLNLGYFIIVIFILKNLFKYLGSVSSVRLQESVIKSLRDKVFTKMTSLSVDFFSKSRGGNLISIITNDINALNSSTLSTFTQLLRDSLQIISFLFVLIAVSASLSLIAFSTSIVSFLIIRVSMRFIRRYAERMQLAMADFTSTLQETISGIRVVKAYNAEKTANYRFLSNTAKYLKSAIKHKKIIAIVPSLNEVLAIVALCVVLFVGGSEVLEKKMNAEDLFQFLFILFAIMSPIANVINILSKYQRGIVAAGRVFSILDEEPTVETGKKKIDEFNDEISIENVNFSYDNETVLKNINFKIKKSKKTALVGPSGSGKSTMLDLIIRFYDPVSGSINIDNKNIKDISVEDYRSLFGIVSQESFLFNDTITNNIRFGNPDATIEQIHEAARVSNAYDFVTKLPEGFETVIGDRGVLLSGGERQRISIARALVRTPQIIVFDEATSSLDSESEKVVQDAINKSLKDKTAVIVAHRLATILDCDIIHVFDDGRIVESGNHQELISKNGIYKRLYDIQFKENS